MHGILVKVDFFFLKKSFKAIPLENNKVYFRKSSLDENFGEILMTLLF